MKGRFKSSAYLRAGPLLLVALAVLVLAWPRMLASLRFLPVERAIGRYFETREIPSDRLEVLIRFAGQSISRHDHYRYHDGLSILHWLRAVDLNTPALERWDAYRAAEQEAIETLRRAPARPDAWMRVANIRWILHDEPDAIVSPWKMSIFTGRTDSVLLVQRVELGLAYRVYLDEEGVAMLRDQLLLAWRLQPGPLIGALARRDRGLAVTADLIRHTDPGALEEMEVWLEKLR